MSGAAQALLVTRTTRWETRWTVMSTIECMPPAVAPHPDGTVELQFRVMLGLPPDGWRYAAFSLRVRLDDANATAVDLRGPPGITRLVFGIEQPAFGWFIGDFEEGVVPAGHHVLKAVILPAAARAVHLVVRADASFVRSRRSGSRLEHARAEAPWEFRIALPPVTGDVVGAPPSETYAGGAAVRLCLAADIEHYSRFRNPEAMRAQERFVDLFRRVRAYAGIEDATIDTESAGDSQFAILSAGTDEATVIPKLIEGLSVALREVNTDLSEHARLRIRVALHRGLTSPGVNGWVGTPVIGVHRLLDSVPARTALARARRADYVLVVAEPVYRDVIQHGYGGLDPDDFEAADVEIPEKGFAEHAFLYTPRR